MYDIEKMTVVNFTIRFALVKKMTTVNFLHYRFSLQFESDFDGEFGSFFDNRSGLSYT